MLRDRTYLGYVTYRGEELPGASGVMIIQHTVSQRRITDALAALTAVDSSVEQRGFETPDLLVPNSGAC